MKHFNIDWPDFLRGLEIWEKLPRESRLDTLQLRRGESFRADKLAGGAEPLRAAGIVEVTDGGRRVRLVDAWHRGVRALAAMQRHNMLAKPSLEMLANYLDDNFTYDELDNLAPPDHYYYVSADFVASIVSSMGWFRALLAEEAPPRKSKGRRSRAPRAKLSPPGRALVQHLAASPQPAPLAELGRRLDLDPPSLAAAIHSAIASAVAFPALDNEARPVLTLWPEVATRLHEPEPLPPKPLAGDLAPAPGDLYEGAFLLEDLTNLLVAAAAEPLPVRAQSGAFYARRERELTAALAPLPSWLDDLFGYVPLGRVYIAARWSEILGFSDVVQASKLQFRTTNRGRDWLALDARQRLRAIWDPVWRKFEENQRQLTHGHRRRRASVSGGEQWDSSDELRLIPETLNISGELADVPFERALVDAYRALPHGAFVDLGGFFRWHARQANPALAAFANRSLPVLWSEWEARPATAEDLERLWSQMLNEFLRLRLVPLAGARVARVPPDGAKVFVLTDVGRYLLGEADDFDYGPPPGDDRQVIVQPNFEIVFLAPAPLAEAVIGPFAERQAAGVGALFKLTKKSIQAAAERRTTAAEVLATLARLSARPLPPNVTREIEGWFEQCRRVLVRPAVLLECPDAETAARVLAAVGNRVARLNETLVEWHGPGNQAELGRKLRTLGIFVEDRTSAPASLPRRGRRHSSRDDYY